MTSGAQHQKAGQGATQVQVAGDLIVGVTEERAKEIAVESARFVVAEYTTEAHQAIQARIDQLDRKVISGLTTAGQLGAFADPSFQRTYRKAQNGAASSERELDYDMLSALLTERAARPRDRPVRAGIERAIEIVDQMDDVALRGLTALEAVRILKPTTGHITMGLNALESFFGQIIDGPLPVGDDWLDHLDVLDVVRVNFASELKKFDVYFAESLSGYACRGVEAESAPVFVGGEFPELQWSALVVDHELKPGFRRLAAVEEERFRRQQISANVPPNLVDTILSQASAELGFATPDEDAAKELGLAMRSRPTLGMVAEWWDEIPNAPRATGVGKVLADANMRRLDAGKQLPEPDDLPVTAAES